MWFNHSLVFSWCGMLWRPWNHLSVIFMALLLFFCLHANIQGSMGSSFAHKNDLASYCKNILALKLIAGQVFAYFLMQMVSLKKSQDITDNFRPPSTSPSVTQTKNILSLLSIMLRCPSTSMCVNLWVESSYSFAGGLKGPHVFPPSCGLVNTCQWFIADRRSAEADAGLWSWKWGLTEWWELVSA